MKRPKKALGTSADSSGPALIHQVTTETQAVYRELAARPIERACTGRAECCHFKLTGRTPFLTRAEALVAAKGLRASGRTRLPDNPSGACPLLSPASGKCLVYEHRPFGCRTHFCTAAGGPFARREVADLIHRLEELSARLKSSDAQPLAAAVKAALDQI